MTGGLLAPLSPPEEIALRRIAHGSLAVVDAKVASRLVALALIQRTSTGLRLTPLGRLRFDALPKAPLLAQQRSVHAMTGYVEGLIEKAQSRAIAHAAAASAKTPDAAAPAPMPAPVDLLLETRDEKEHRGEFTIGPRFSTTSTTSNGSPAPRAPCCARGEPWWSIANGRSGSAMPASAASSLPIPPQGERARPAELALPQHAR